MDSGAPYAVTVGTFQMRQLFVERWDTKVPGLRGVVMITEVALAPFG